MIPAFQRSIVQNELRNQYSNWQKPETKDSFFGKFNTSPFFEDFGIVRNSNGYFYLSDHLIVYNDLKNGNIFRIKKSTNPKSWDCYSDLYLKSQELKSFRIDQPLFKDNILVGKELWEYAELQSPGKDYGRNYNDDVFLWPELTNGLVQENAISVEYKQSVEKYFTDFVDQALVIIQEAVSIAKKHSCGLPLNLCRLSTRYKDDQGYFWSDFDQDEWNSSALEFYEWSVTAFGSTLQFANKCGVLDTTQVSSCLTYASEKWKIF